MKPPNSTIYTILIYFQAATWLINGLYCKILNFVPRHEQIVAAILGSDYARIFTLLIGASEIIMALWVLSRYKSRLNAVIQIMIVAIMNTLEFILVPDLLLWGKFNSLFAFLFICLIYYTEFLAPARANAGQ